MMYNYQVISC